MASVCHSGERLLRVAQEAGRQATYFISAADGGVLSFAAENRQERVACIKISLR
jgi:hypothetical protein